MRTLHILFLLILNTSVFASEYMIPSNRMQKTNQYSTSSMKSENRAYIQVSNYKYSDSVSIPALSLMWTQSPLTTIQSILISPEMGLRFMSNERTKYLTFYGSQQKFTQTETLTSLPLSFRFEQEKIFQQKFIPYFSMGLLPTYILASESVFAKAKSEFTLPLNLSAGLEWIHSKSGLGFHAGAEFITPSLVGTNISGIGYFVGIQSKM